jgi:IS5 family transposase
MVRLVRPGAGGGLVRPGVSAGWRWRSRRQPAPAEAVYADKAYGKRARRETPKARGIEDRTQHRRVRGQLALPPWQAMRNKLIGRVRTAVEHIFSELKRGPYGFVRMRYRGLTRCRLHFDLSVIACNLRRAAG